MQTIASRLGFTLVVALRFFYDPFPMNIHIVLHVVDEDLLLFAGPPDKCPPIPRAGDEIIHQQRRVRLEGIRYHYGPEQLEISLLA